MFSFPSDFFLFFAHKKCPDSGDWLVLASGDTLTTSGHPCVAFDPPAARTVYISFIAHRFVSIIA